jgi:hypothetical protein
VRGLTSRDARASRNAWLGKAGPRLEPSVEGGRGLTRTQADALAAGHVHPLALQRRQIALPVDGVERHDGDLTVGVAARRVQKDQMGSADDVSQDRGIRWRVGRGRRSGLEAERAHGVAGDGHQADADQRREDQRSPIGRGFRPGLWRAGHG